MPRGVDDGEIARVEPAALEGRLRRDLAPRSQEGAHGVDIAGRHRRRNVLRHSRAGGFLSHRPGAPDPPGTTG